MCVPLLESFTSGYIQKTHCDLFIGDIDNELNMYSSGPIELATARESTFLKDAIEEKFYPVDFSWKLPWVPKTKRGYSVLITHPLNRFDLPFLTMSGVIDSDNFHHAPFPNLPFFVDKNFSGVIPEGTPICQIIPFKRDDWESSKLKKFNQSEWSKKRGIALKNFHSVYKNNFWIKKKY